MRKQTPGWCSTAPRARSLLLSCLQETQMSWFSFWPILPASTLIKYGWRQAPWRSRNSSQFTQLMQSLEILCSVPCLPYMPSQDAILLLSWQDTQKTPVSKFSLSTIVFWKNLAEVIWAVPPVLLWMPSFARYSKLAHAHYQTVQFTQAVPVKRDFPGAMMHCHSVS